MARELMASLIQLVPWILLSVPVVSLFRWYELRSKHKGDYSRFVELKEFPIWKISLGKLVFFGLLGLGSVFYSTPFDKTMVALVTLGTCGYIIEGTIAFGRPMPVPGYRITSRVCQKCSLSDHEHCTNLRMLDGFEKDFKSQEGLRRPVCCCGFRLRKWEEAQV